MPPNLNDIAYGNGSFVAVGDYSTILQSGALNGRPEIMQSPQSLTTVPGDFISLGVVATGVAPLQFQWFKDGTNVAGAVNSIFSVTNVQPSDAGNYTVTVTNALGSDSSAVATVTVVATFPLDFWHWRNPLPQGNDIIDVVYGNGRFVLATVDGVVGVLFDGTSLGGVSRLPAGLPFNYLQSLSFANGQFFAGSSSLLSSGDGITWSGSNIFYGAASVAYGNGVYAGTDPPYGAVCSTDGVNWTNSNVNLSFSVGHLVFANGVFVAAGYTYNNPGSEIFTSVDGINWTSRGYYVGRFFQSLAYGNQLFVIVGDQGDVFTSPDGIHWTLRNSTTQNSLWKITFGNNRFVAVGDGATIISSADGINWSPADTAAFSGYTLTSVAGGGGRFIAVGKGGLILGSSNAITWTAISSSVTPQPLNSCASGGGTVVSVGYRGTVLTSANGVSWTNQNSGTFEPLNKVIHANGRFIAVGGEGAILTSTNGANWVARDSGTVAGLNGIAYGNGSYVAVGNGVVLRSSDATNWSVIREGNWLNAIAFGTNLFVAVGENGLIISSTNLAQWQTNLVSTSNPLYGVAYGNDQFVAVGDQSTIMRATAPFFGTPFWSTVPQTGFPESLFDVTYGNGEFVAVGVVSLGYLSSSFPSVITSSENGMTWTNRPTPSYNPLYGVTTFGNSLITVGDYGTILQSDPFTALSLGIQIVITNDPVPMPVVQLTVTGIPGFRYVIESNDSLSNPGMWLPVVPDFVLTNSPQIVTLPVPGPQQQGFFRARRSTLP
ncbi:MAG TPA: immunoglobulin domain-containing protein [Verrucomicrobiae bacterium]|nr:immunoglobulin domain-containing protein [Verrucomicrobiae bacterium]